MEYPFKSFCVLCVGNYLWLAIYRRGGGLIGRIRWRYQALLQPVPHQHKGSWYVEANRPGGPDGIGVFFCFFLLDMFIQHSAFLLNKGSQDRRRGILPPAVSNYCYGLLVLV